MDSPLLASLPAAPAGPPTDAELVVLLDEAHRPIGTAPKAGVHTRTTPLHLAFSCHISDPDGRLLLTRRALGKATWPGVWTNSVCGHPAPGESSAEAVARRARAELGLVVSDLHCALPDFAYRATDASGVVENEVCPVWTAVTDADPQPDPTEVAEWRWVAFDDAVEVAGRAPWALSPWATSQLIALAAQRPHAA